MTTGVATIEELSNVITGAPFEINGDGFGSGITAPTGTFTEVASIDTASEADQIALTRDSNPGTIVFEDPEGTIQIFDSDTYRTGAAAHTIGSDTYSQIDQTFDDSHVINVLTLKYVEKIKTGKKATRKVELDQTFQDDDSITKYGKRKKTVTVHKKADFSNDYALKVFAKNADPDPVPASVTIPINTAADLLPGYEDGTYVGGKVDVVLPDGVTTYTCRISSIQHDLTVVDSGGRKTVRWMVQVFLRNQSVIQRPVSDRMAVNTEVGNNPDGTVLTAHLDDKAVTTGKIDDAAVTEAQLADGAVTAAKTDFTVNDIGGHKFTTSSTAPSNPAAGDFWVDSGNGNELKTWNGSAWVSIQDAAIAAAQDAADDAQTTADGKNKVTYSTSTPGTTANAAGDIWFQTSGSTIIGQWRGNGGTSWTSVTLTNSVISTLDAGKITTGILSASRIGAGTITSTMLAANSVVAGKIAAGAIDAMTITGPVIQTDSSGNRLVIHDDGSAGSIDFYTGQSGESSPGKINPGTSDISSGGEGSRIDFITSLVHSPELARDLTQAHIALQGEDIALNPQLILDSNTLLQANGGLNASQGGSLDGGWNISGGVVLTGGTTISGTMDGGSTWTNTGDIHGRKLFADAHDSQTGSANVRFNGSEQLVTATSLSKYKIDQEPITLDEAQALLDLTPITWFDRFEVEENGGSTEGLRRIPGVTAEDVEAHIPILADYDGNGDLRGVAYDRMLSVALLLIRAQDEALEALTARVTELEARADG